MAYAFHDYRCPTCGVIRRDVAVPVSEGALAHPPACPACLCGGSYTLMTWIPNIGAVDAKEPFQRFETFDGQNRRVTVDSLKKLRQIEKESEQQFKNGEGQPIVFRAWSNDNSNKDQSALHKSWDGGEHPTEDAKRKFGSPIRTTNEDAGEFGPGVTDANTSALGKVD